MLKTLYRLYGRAWEWRWFSWTVRSKGCHLLAAADRFQRPIFVAGCQRSGTTLVTRAIWQSPDIVNFRVSKDEELDAAYLLCGKRSPASEGRHCFQTTYLNECYSEYLSLESDFRLIWVLRNPYSVVYSMAFNWARYPLNELFMNCGIPYLNDPDRVLYNRFGLLGLNPIKRACYAYVGKLSHLFDLKERLEGGRLLVVEYDEVVRDREQVLQAIYQFLGLEFNENYVNIIRSSSLDKASRLSSKEAGVVKVLCMDAYEKASLLVNAQH